MKPITYWIQNDAIDQLVEDWGATLHELEPQTRRELISRLAESHEWNCNPEEPHLVEMISPIVENLTRHEKDLLIEAIAATLTHQP